MNKWLLICLIAAGLWSWQQSRTKTAEPDTPHRLTATTPPPPAANFRCDGRTHCSQMTSCEEATFFLRNCPNTKMDGNNDGVPCEKQWCR